MSNCGIKPARTPVTFRTTTARDLRDCFRVMVDHLVERPDHLRLLFHLLLELVQTLEDLLHAGVCLVDIFTMTISTNIDPIDLVVVGLQDATDLLEGRSRILLQFIPLWC